MSKGQTAANDYLKLVYNATAIANIADNAASSPLTSIWLALHSADPGDTGTASTSEISYTGYARPAVARSGAGWTVTTDSVALAATQSFGACTAGSATAMFFSTTVASSGTSKILHSGPIGSRLGPFTAATSDTITIPGLSGMAVDDRIVFYATQGSTVPSGMTEGTVYFVKTVSGADITISTTSGGAAVDLTTVGDGVAFKVTPIAISAGVTPQLGTGTTIYEE